MSAKLIAQIRSVESTANGRTRAVGSGYNGQTEVLVYWMIEPLPSGLFEAPYPIDSLGQHPLSARNDENRFCEPIPEP